MNINVCISSDDKYSKYAGVLIASILHNAKSEDYLNFYILDNEITQENQTLVNSLKKIKDCSINFIKVDENDFSEYKKVKTHDYITINTYYRLKLATILPEVDKIIYLDCDMVVNCSLEELFNFDLKDNCAGGALDIAYRRMNRKTKLPFNNRYINAGMLLLDLKKIRENGMEEKFSTYAVEHAHEIFCGDQEIINVVLMNNISAIPPKWNVQVSNFSNRSNYTKHPCIIHYVSYQKPWIYASWNYFNELYLKYQQMTPWALKEETYTDWTTKGKMISAWNYFKYRPLFFLHPRFWVAVFCTYPR